MEGWKGASDRDEEREREQKEGQREREVQVVLRYLDNFAHVIFMQIKCVKLN